MSHCKLQNVSDPAEKIIGTVQGLIKTVSFLVLVLFYFFETISPACECKKIINYRIKGKMPGWKGPQASSGPTFPGKIMIQIK